ncbi:glucan biosynthesis protein [Psychromonas sp.]|uniref:glucan biosynthesis protein n=1 Tax=Psychromonas sp. TaxID=1884585 RepID=UPI003A97EAEF
MPLLSTSMRHFTLKKLIVVSSLLPGLAISDTTFINETLPSAQAADTPNIIYAVNGEFNRNTVINLARDLAKESYQEPDSTLPAELQDLNYDQYRDIRFNPNASIWKNQSLPFQMQLFHRGFYFKETVEVAIVENGQSQHLRYNPEMFTTGEVMQRALPNADVGFAGIRLHNPLNSTDYYDEVAVFQGGSYFRSLGKHQGYGLSARGLALKTADPEGEEFPAFRAFWIEKPANDSSSIVVYALLDSPSTTGAYRFTIRPGDNTVMDVEATLFPREDLDKVGLAPATSMFMFSSYDRDQVDDFRPRVHDSDGLLMINGRGDRLWRPLRNPNNLEVSAFSDNGPLGFGLIQRNRDFNNFQDLEAKYEQRPSLWVEPLGDWARGSVVLVEIPTDSEVNDNIVAYWAPNEVIPAGSEYHFAYRLLWGQAPSANKGEAIVEATRNGRASINGPTEKRLFVIDYRFPNPTDNTNNQNPTAHIENTAGEIHNVVVAKNHNNGYRVTFELDPLDAELIELRLDLQFTDGRKAENWMYQWTK